MVSVRLGNDVCPMSVLYVFFPTAIVCAQVWLCCGTGFVWALWMCVSYAFSSMMKWPSQSSIVRLFGMCVWVSEWVCDRQIIIAKVYRTAYAMQCMYECLCICHHVTVCPFDIHKMRGYKHKSHSRIAHETVIFLFVVVVLWRCFGPDWFVL